MKLILFIIAVLGILSLVSCSDAKSAAPTPPKRVKAKVREALYSLGAYRIHPAATTEIRYIDSMYQKGDVIHIASKDFIIDSIAR
jgi:hypothetical protein